MSESHDQLRGHPVSPELQLAVEFDLTPETGEQLLDGILAHGFALFGHGTKTDEGVQNDPNDFFKHGVITTQPNGNVSATNVLDMAISITPPQHGEQDAPVNHPSITDVYGMTHWAHRRGTMPSDVVLLAVPNPDLAEGVTMMGILDHTIAVTPDSDVSLAAFPPDLIVGFLRAADGRVTLNRDFHPGEKLRKKHLQRVVSTTEAIANRPIYGVAGNIGSSAVSEEAAVIPVVTGSSSDMPTVW